MKPIFTSYQDIWTKWGRLPENSLLAEDSPLVTLLNLPSCSPSPTLKFGNLVGMKLNQQETELPVCLQ